MVSTSELQKTKGKVRTHMFTLNSRDTPCFICLISADESLCLLCVFSFFTSSQREPSSGITKTEAWTPMKLNMRCVCVRDQKQASSVQTSSLSPACLTRSFAFPQGKKAELKRYIIELSKEFSILSQFTSFVAIEERVCQTFQYLYFCSTQPAHPLTLHPGLKVLWLPAKLNSSISF